MGLGLGGGRGSPRLAFSASTFHVSAAAPASAKSPAPAFSAERFHMVASSAWMVKTQRTLTTLGRHCATTLFCL